MSALVLEVLLGVPGSGKSTWATSQACGRVLTADGVRLDGDGGSLVLAQLRSRAERLLRRGDCVTIDACSTQERRRADWLALAAATGAHSRLVVLDVAAEVAHRRNAGRPRAERVPWPVLQRYVRAWPYVLEAARAEPWAEIVSATWRPVSSGAWAT